MSPPIDQDWHHPVVFYYDPLVYSEWEQQAQMDAPYFPTNSSIDVKQMEWLWHHFQKENGELDLDKVFKTLGQVVQLSQQVTPIVKTLSSFVRPSE